MLACRDLRFAHETRALFVDASMSIDDGERVALVGANGAGKSTLLSILAGTLRPDSGVVERGRGQRVGILAQEPNLDPDATVVDVARAAIGPVMALLDEHKALCQLESFTDAQSDRISKLTEMIDEVGGFNVEHRVEEVLSRLGVQLRNEPVRALSGGGRRRLDLARLLLSRPEILLLDEPTNHLDVGAMKFVEDELKSHRGPVLFISHDRAFIDAVGTRIVELVTSKLYPHAPPADDATGLYASFLEGKLIRDEIAMRTNHRKGRLWLRELAWLRAGTPARTTKQSARIGRAAELHDEVETLAGQIRERKAKVQLERSRTDRLGKSILSMDKLGIDRGGRTLFDNLSLILTPGDRWGIVGDNGVGKTSLLTAILTAAGEIDDVSKQLLPTRGTLTIGMHTTIAVFDQHRAGLDPELTLEETLSGQNDHVIIDGERMHIVGFLERFLFDGSDRKRRVKTLSGGEQNRLVLARMFLSGANLLLLDEPTNDLDVTTLGVLEETVLDHPGVAIVVSHDRAFLDRVCTGILAFERTMKDGREIITATPYVGDYTNYERLRAQKAGAPVPTVAPSQGPSSTSTPVVAPVEKRTAKRKRSYKEEQELQSIEARVLEAETKREALQAKLAQGDVFRSDLAEATRMSATVTTLDGEIERLYARWQELADLGAA